MQNRPVTALKRKRRDQGTFFYLSCQSLYDPFTLYERMLHGQKQKCKAESNIELEVNAMRGYEWVELIKRETDLKSDNKVALAIGITRSAISDHKHGRAASFYDEQCIKIAELLGLEPIVVIADQRAAGAKNDSMKAVWEKIKRNIVVVPRDGIEPPTRGFSILCS
ncbi:hypothetical protein, partial [uncultured Zhongshania sp.]|uniref:hypothetical protein n=1 Tax=uncultured Zhongshania sp. TaxID=1642288 RepID=UPI0030DB251B